MDTAQHAAPRCPVYLHPAAASNPFNIRRIEHATGLTVCAHAGRAMLKPAAPTEPFGPWDGGSAA
jgi:hypothetical protein